jgi:energy-coupling factor transport system permease protein
VTLPQHPGPDRPDDGSAPRGRLNPLTGLVLAGAAVVVCLAWASWSVWLAVLAAALVAASRARVLSRVAAAGSVVVVPFALWALAIHGLFFPEGRTVLAEVGPARVTAEGLDYVALFVLRTATLVVVMLAFSLWVDVATLRVALVRRGVPVSGRLAGIRAAQEARGLVVRRGIAGRVVAARLQVVPLVLQLVDEAGERATALEARGSSLRGRRTFYVEEPDSRLQRWVRWSLAVASLAVVASVVVPAVVGTFGSAG